MTILIQDPSDQATSTLHEVLLQLAAGAETGAGMFAFATRDGVHLLMSNDPVLRMLERGPFKLIVGVDAITDDNALQSLSELCGRYPNLSACAFLHGVADATFHPKLSWFQSQDQLTVVTGSGNLTARGLRGNWEAFSIDQLTGEEKTSFQEVWNSWVRMHQAELRDLDDPEVIQRARENRERSRRVRQAARAEGRPNPGEDLDEVAGSYPTLVAEIPKGGGRWNQANFDIQTFTDFFGARPDAQHIIVLQHVQEDGSRGAIENRPSVAVQSQNYRFELAAGSGLDYPENGRPIGVFVRMAPRTFLYRLLLPHFPGYEEVDRFLREKWDGPERKVRRVVTDSEDLRRVWPDSPLW